MIDYPRCHAGLAASASPVAALFSGWSIDVTNAPVAAAIPGAV